jgi:hypothetical protein
MSEFGDLADVIFGMMYLFLSLWFVLLTSIIVRGRAVVIRRAHIDIPGMFARAAAICGGDTTSPAFAVAGGCSIHKLQGFVFEVWIGVGSKSPDPADFLIHVSG